MERLDTFPSTDYSTLPPSARHFNNNKIVDSNLNKSVQYSKNSSEENLRSKNKTLQKKITLLTGRIKVYENEYFEKTNKLNNQIKDFGLIEMNYKNQIENQNSIIEQLKIENKVLKSQIKELEEKIRILKKEVKNAYRINLKNENKIGQKNRNYSHNKIIEVPKLIFKEKEVENPETERKMRDLIYLIKQYSKEISKLKNENINLSKNLSFNESSLSKSLNYNNLSIYNNDSFLMPISTFINKEINLINQWIDTYMGDNYDKNYEVPSLINDSNNSFSKIHENNNLNTKLIDYLQFDLLKNTLEKSRSKINNMLNQNERKVMEYKISMKKTENNNSELQEELNILKQEIINLTFDKKIKIHDIENLKSENLINQLKSKLNESKNDNDKFLNYLYELVSNELNNIFKDFNFQNFHEELLENFGNSNNLKDLLSLSLEKLIEFISYLKYDYIKTKEENFQILNQKTEDTFQCYNNNNIH